jgi:hypothetical protein
MSLFVLSIVAPNAFAQNHIVEIKTPGSTPVDSTTAAIVLWCSPDVSTTFGQSIAAMNLTFEEESKALVTALFPRKDIGTLIFMSNPTSAEVNAWLAGQKALIDGNRFRETIVSIACPSIGGDTDEEILFTRDVADPSSGEGLAFTDFAMQIGSMSQSSVWLLDASRDVSKALEPGSTSFGPTADDIPRLGVKDAFAISSGSAGRYAGGGLIAAAAKVIDLSKGESLALEWFYYRGIKPLVPELDLATSMGMIPNDSWDRNMTRLVLVGGGLIDQPLVVVDDDPKKKPKIPLGCWVAGGGVITAIAGTSLLISASGHYQLLEDFNRFGGVSNAELAEEIGAYRTNLSLGFSIGGIGLAAIAGGTAWTMFDRNDVEVSVAPTNNGILLQGSF